MRKLLLPAILAALTAFEAWALPDGYAKHNLSGHDVWQSSESSLNPSNAIDGVNINFENPLSGWGSDDLVGKLEDNKLTKGSNWWMVDLGEGAVVDAVKIYFEGAYATDFDIEFFDSFPSDNETPVASSFTFPGQTLKDDNGDKVFKFESTFSSQTHRYMRLNFYGAHNAGWGIKFYEVETYSDLKNATSANLTNTAGTTGLVAGKPTQLSASFFNEKGASLGSITEGFTVSSTDSGVTIDGTTVTVSQPGEYKLSLTYDGKDYGETTFTAVPAIANMQNAVYSYGPWTATVININPAEGFGHPEYFFDGKTTENDEGGWADKTLGPDNVLATPATFTVDMKRPVNVSALRLFNSGAVFTNYDIELLGADNKVIKTVSYTSSNTAASSSEEIYLDKIYGGVRYIRFNIKSIYNHDWGGRFREIEVYGPDNATFEIDRISLVRRDVCIGETRDFTIYGITPDGTPTDPLSGATFELLKGGTGEASYDAATKKITGVTKGLVPVRMSWTDPVTNNTYTTETNLEVTTKDWSNEINIARRFASIGMRTMDQKKNGMLFHDEKGNFFYGGNPASVAYAVGAKGGENENVRGLIDGDWMAFSIQADEMAKEEKPYVIIDLGYAFPIDEFAIHWNADAKGTWGMLSANFNVYGSADGEEWTKVYTMANRAHGTYDIGRHVFPEGRYRYVKFEFTSPKIAGNQVSINEIVIGGSKFKNEDGSLKAYPEADVLKIETPTFDRSNQADRAHNNDWIVTSTAINPANALALSYMARDCYGRELTYDNEAVKIYKYDGETRGDEVTRGEGTKQYHNTQWPYFPYAPEKIGQETFRAVVGEKVSAPFTVYTVSDRGNVNRYAYAYDNAVNYSENWENEVRYSLDKDGNVIGNATGDRDLLSTGTSPQNAADGNWGSWYAVGYYGPADHMGATYKYPANWTFEKPYELVMDYRGMNHDDVTNASRFARKLDMIGIKYEGAFPRDYDVYLLHCDGETGSTEGKDWVKVATFNGMQEIGVGQNETHRIYPADEHGEPLLWDSEGVDDWGNPHVRGQIKSWENVAAVKIVFRTTGTQWGIKIMESAIYGFLNKTVMPLALDQLAYADREGKQTGKTYKSFDLGFNNDYSGADLVEADIDVLKRELPKVAAYSLELTAQKLVKDAWVNEKMTEGNAPDAYYAIGSGAAPQVGTLTDDGTLTFTVPADDTDHLLKNFALRNADPSMSYILSATPLDEEGKVLNDIEINNSKRTSLDVPVLRFVPKALSVSAVDTKVSGAVNADERTAALGHRDGKHDANYAKANVVSLDGVFEPLNVTNAVLRDWTVNYNLDIKADGMGGGSFNTVFAKERPALNKDHDGSLSYLPLTTEVKTAGELFAEELAAAPADLKNQQLRVLSDQTVGVTAKAKVILTRGERVAEAEPTESDEVVLSTDVIAAKLTAIPDAEPSYSKAAHDATGWNAFVTLPVEDTNKDLHSVVGFYASSEDHSGFNADFKGGWPVAESDNPLHEPFGMADFSGKEGGFAAVAHETGELSFGLQHFVDADAPDKLTEDVEGTFYTLLTNEYPIALAPADAEGNLAAAPALTFTTKVDGQAYKAEGEQALAEGDANIQAIDVATPKTVTIKLLADRVTAIDGVMADNGSLSVFPNPAVDTVTLTGTAALGNVEVYTLDGRRVIALDTDEQQVRLDVTGLAAGVYIVSADGATTRLIKR